MWKIEEIDLNVVSNIWNKIFVKRYGQLNNSLPRMLGMHTTSLWGKTQSHGVVGHRMMRLNCFQYNMSLFVIILKVNSRTVGVMFNGDLLVVFP